MFGSYIWLAPGGKLKRTYFLFANSSKFDLCDCNGTVLWCAMMTPIWLLPCQWCCYTPTISQSINQSINILRLVGACRGLYLVKIRGKNNDFMANVSMTGMLSENWKYAGIHQRYLIYWKVRVSTGISWMILIFYCLVVSSRKVLLRQEY